MPNTKISNLTSAGALTGTEDIPIVQSGTTVKTTAQDIANLAAGGVPTSRTLTINGTSYDLSANRTWNVGTVTGGGTNDFIPKISGTQSLTNSLLSDSGTVFKTTYFGTDYGINLNFPLAQYSIGRINYSYLELNNFQVTKLYQGTTSTNRIGIEFNKLSDVIETKYNSTSNIGLVLNFSLGTVLLSTLVSGPSATEFSITGGGGPATKAKVGGTGTYIDVVTGLGGAEINFNSATNQFRFNNVQVFADSAAAIAGGLAVGDIFRITGTDQLGIVN